MSKPFEKKVPSVFSVTSPFQALCAIAAIRQLEIDDYKMIVRLPRGARSQQTENTLKYYGIKYTGVRHINRLTVVLIKLIALIRRHNRYKRLFIGDYRDKCNIYLGCGIVSDEADVVYLDDGNPTISQLRGRDTEPFNEGVARFMSRIANRRGFVFNKSIFTIYNDINNDNYIIGGLKLDLITFPNSNCTSPSAGVYIVGTNVERYCLPMNLSVDHFISYLDKLMMELKGEFPDEDIVYIAHGRETLQYAQNLCKKNECLFCQPSTMVELELLSYGKSPKLVIGFGSNALFTLKKMYPSIRVVNILFNCDKDNPFYIDKLDFAKYYQQNGIELIEVQV